MSALEAELVRLIGTEGPLSVARYIELGLADPEHGYYQRHDPFGAGGDFVTAPEISQMFGEIVGLFLAQAWLDLGAPAPVRLVELGPGRGTLARDLLRVAQAVPGFREAIRLHLVERSERLIAEQRQRLDEPEVHWHGHLDDVPDGPALAVANEFLDALPVHQLVRRGDVWRERLVGLHGSRLGVLDGPAAAADLAALAPAQAPDGSLTEVSPVRVALVQELARRLTRDPGLALLIDYGAAASGPTGDTLQAVRAHRTIDPFAEPGAADLSTQVEFTSLVAAAEAAGAAAYGPVPQGTFLRTLGIPLRAARLMERSPPERHPGIRRALQRLTDASAMGELFKVLVLTSPGGPVPPGFAAMEGARP